jgi:hypothetical protein
MKPLHILVCGGDTLRLRQITQALHGIGVTVEASAYVTDRLCTPCQEWDVLIVDLDALNSFLRGLLPAVRLQFPELNIVGISAQSPASFDSFLEHDLKLDARLTYLPKLEDLIAQLPNVAASFLFDTGELRSTGSKPLPA